MNTIKIFTDIVVRLYFLARLKENIRTLLLQKLFLTLREEITEVAKLRKSTRTRMSSKAA
jgi:hypothetical protein